MYVDVGDRDKNKAIFDMLYEQKEMIETDFGDKLDWMRLDDKRASRIKWIISGHGSLNEPETWSSLQDILIDAMIRFDRVMRPCIGRLQL